MELFVGLDVSQQTTVICIVDATGSQIWQGQCRTDPASLAAKIQKHAPNASRIGLESGPLAQNSETLRKPSDSCATAVPWWA
jgi:transposase